MSQIQPVLIFFVIAGIAFAISKYFDHRRMKAVRAIATQLGFDYCGQSRQFMHGSVWRSELFTKGRNGYIKNLIRGQVEDLPIAVADYQYTTGSGKNKRTVRQTVAVVELQQTSLPQFSLNPETVFHKIGGLFGYEDIDFETHPDFSKHYCLKGNDEAAIRDCFFSDVLSFFENHRQFWVESTGAALIIYKRGRSHKPQDWQKLINSACRVYRQF
ncbi:MAG: hypothetical protein AAGN15_11325 [Cyanobacteria bacterium J06581_3]